MATDCVSRNNLRAFPPALEGRFHHVGFVVKSIENTAPQFLESVGVSWDGRVIPDPLQGVRVAFLSSRLASDPLLELVEPVGESSPVQKFLQQGGGLHHLCYEVKDLDRQLEYILSTGAKMVRAPLPAAAFGGRRIVWVYTRARLLLEYLEIDKQK
jgi:methylmalonyl-CoA epimerase